jgi:uncharacterized protein YgiM (DUF1202 family)
VVGAERGLNVRSGPGVENSVVGSLPNGSQVTVLGYEDGWYQVFFSTEQDPLAVGYVSETYLQ